jgi:hypothetical protein
VAGGVGGLAVLGALFVAFTSKDAGKTTAVEPPKTVKSEPPPKPERTAGLAPLNSTTTPSPASSTPAPVEAGWTSLITTESDLATHWQTPGSFRLVSGELQSDKKGAAVSKDSYDDFDLEFEWKVAKGANGGLFYRTNPTAEQINAGSLGMEYQVIDNASFEKLAPQGSAGALWGLAGPSRDATKPVGEWNSARILAVGNHIEHWMNGEKLLETEVGSQAWKDALSKANINIRANAGQPRGHIVLQSQGAMVSFRNMRIRRSAGGASPVEVKSASAASLPSPNSAGWIDLLASVVPNSENSRATWTRNSNGHLGTNSTAESPFPQMSFGARPFGSYEIEVGVILHDADHVILHMPASSGVANLTLGRRAGGAVWQTGGPFDPAGQPAEQKVKVDVKPNVESVMRIRVDVKENGGRVRLSGKVDGELLPILDRPATELSRVSPPKSVTTQPLKNPSQSFALHVGVGSTATVTRFRYREVNQRQQD